MRSFWKKTSDKQPDLLDADVTAQAGQLPMAEGSGATPALAPHVRTNGQPLMVPVSALDEDTANPRTEFPDATLDDLAADIRERGILQPIIVEPLGEGLAVRYRVRLGARRLRTALRAGLIEVPVTVASRPLDAYAQVAENLKRDGLSPLELARFMRGQVDAGESNATIAKHLGIDQTTVAHHWALLALPPVLDAALDAGRCASPRTLYKLSKLHADQPERVAALVNGSAPITRDAVADIRDAAPAASAPTSMTTPKLPRHDRTAQLLARANGLCEPLDVTLLRLSRTDLNTAPPGDMPAYMDASRVSSEFLKF